MRRITRRSRVAIGALLFGASMAHAQGIAARSARPSPARTTETLAREVMAELIAINTTVSTGSTTIASRKLAARFTAAGFAPADVMVMGAGARSQNLIVRLRGRTRAKPIVFSAHLDVVEAPRLDWGTDPFVLTEKEGFLYGRGVTDDKGPAAAIVAAFLSYKRQQLVPERDLVLALTAGEESDVENGVVWLLDRHRALVDAEYVLNLDSGGAQIVNGKVRSFGVESAEKVYLDLELVARGPGGHSSIPPVQTPIDQLARALERVGRHTFPVTINPVIRSFLEKSGPVEGGEQGAAMSALAREPNDLRAQTVLLNDRWMNAILRTTCVATMLRGGTAPNAIPQEVSATVNCRVMPGTAQEAIVRALRSAVADSNITVRVVRPMNPSGPSVPTAAFLAMIERVVAAEHPGIPVIPYMETGATDGLWFRNVGIPVFGVNGFYEEETDLRRAHGKDERISVTGFGAMVRHAVRLLAEVALTK